MIEDPGAGDCGHPGFILRLLLSVWGSRFFCGDYHEKKREIPEKTVLFYRNNML